MRIVKPAALAAAAVLCAALLTACTAASSSAAASPSPSPSMTPETSATASPAPGDAAATGADAAAAGYTAAGLNLVLDGCITYGDGTAGSSLKAAIAANDLVRYTAQYGKGHSEEIETDAEAWYNGLDDGQRSQMDANWPGVCNTARAITDAPENAEGLLQSAGVTTDFSGVDLDTAAACITVLDGVFSAEPQKS